MPTLRIQVVDVVRIGRLIEKVSPVSHCEYVLEMPILSPYWTPNLANAPNTPSNNSLATTTGFG